MSLAMRLALVTVRCQSDLSQHNVREFLLGAYWGIVGKMLQEDKADMSLTILQQVQQEGKHMGTVGVGGWGGMWGWGWKVGLEVGVWSFNAV